MELVRIAKALGLKVQGDATTQITGLAPIANAGPGNLSFVVNKKFLNSLSNTKASAVIAPAEMASAAPCPVLISDNPYLSYADASQYLYPDATTEASLADSASVATDVQIGADVSIGENVVVESGVSIGRGTRIGAGCFVGKDSTIGENCLFYPGVTLYHGCQVGDSCRFQSGAVIGSEGFGYARAETGWRRIQQVGAVLIGNRVEVGANTTIDRGALDDTIIEDDVILDNQIQVGHNVRIGQATAIAACVGIAGSATIGKNCTVGGKVAIVGHLTIADNVHLTGTSFVTSSITEPGSYSSGMPIQPTQRWRRNTLRLTKLDELFKSVKKLTSESPNS